MFKMNLSLERSFTISIDKNTSSNIFSKILVFLSCLFIHNVFACGYYLEPLCISSSPCQSELGLEPDATNQYCTLSAIKNKIWKTYPIDDSRDNTEDCNGMNCWKYDDIIKNKLNMDSNQLEYAEQIFGEQKPLLEIRAHDIPHDGRYIYVIRTTDGKMVMRHYDQEYTTTNLFPLTVRFDYSRFRDLNNYRLQGNNLSDGLPCTPFSLLPLGATCNYLYVRHSQLNGTSPAVNDSYQESNAWDPVYCAGELRVHNNKIDRINNRSEYFSPNAKCVLTVIAVLKALDIPIDDNVQTGSYKKISTSEVFDCRNTQNEIIPIVTDSHYHACGYIVFSQSPIGGLVVTPIDGGKNICVHPDIIWIWSHSHTCSGQTYSRGAEY